MNTYSASHLYHMGTNEEMSFLISTLGHIEHWYIHVTILHCPAPYQSCTAGDSECRQYPDSHTKENTGQNIQNLQERLCLWLRFQVFCLDCLLKSQD